MRTGPSFSPERIPPELRLLIQSVRRFLNPEASVDVKENLDWDLVAAAARWHRVHPILLKSLRDRIPEKQRSQLQELYKGQTRQGLVMAASMNRLISGFQKAGIPVLQVKGISLATLAYGDLSMRTSVDLDLLLRPEDAARAIDMLQSEFHFKPYEPMTPRHVRWRTRVDCEEALTDGLISLDVHWACSLFREMFPLDVDVVVQNPHNVEVAGTQTPTLPLPSLIAYLCFHGAKHQWAKLFWIADIAALIMRCPDIQWEQVVEAAIPLRQKRSLAQAISLAHFLFECPIPPAVQAIIDEDPEVEPLVYDTLVHLFERDHTGSPYEIEVSLAQKVRWELRLYPKRTTRLAILLRYLFQPGSSDIRAVSLPGLLYPVYYLVRPFRLGLREILRKKSPKPS